MTEHYEHRNREQFDTERARLVALEDWTGEVRHFETYVDFLEAKGALNLREIDRLQDELKTANATVSALLKHEVPWARPPANEQVLP